MPFVKVVEQSEAPPEVQPLYVNLAASRGGVVPDLFKVLGHSAAMLGPTIAVADFVNAPSAVSAKDKQIAYIATSRYNNCAYCLQRHIVAALKVGLTDEQAQAFRQSGDLSESRSFNATEKAIIKLAEELAATGLLSRETFERSRQHFNDEQLVELVYVAASANMFNRIANGLHVELEPEFLSR